MALSLDSLDLLPPTGGEGGTPLQIPLVAIDEDPEQPRQEFDEQSLAELAETIRERGVRQPVSVRTHPTQPGRWMLNFGARRLRACKRVGLSEIPAFVDQTANSVDQFIENEQRKGLSPLEIALFVQRALNKGQTQADIARAIGKSRQYVMIATALIDPPEWLMVAYREGRCRGMNELHELRKIHAAHPDRVEAWAAASPVFSRDRVAALRTQLEADEVLPEAPSRAVGIKGAVSRPNTVSTPAPPEESRDQQPKAEVPSPSLVAELDGAVVCVLTDVIPEEEGHVYIRGRHRLAKKLVRASALKLIGFAVVGAGS